jgi:hypothetical protein
MGTLAEDEISYRASASEQDQVAKGNAHFGTLLKIFVHHADQ